MILAGAIRLAVIAERKLSDFNPDEMVFGLMALHILEGTEVPVFFWSQPYLGTLEAWLAAGLFHLAGSSLFVLQLAPLIFSLGFVFTTFFLSRSLFDETVGLWASSLAAFPPAFFVLWSIKSSGNIETPFFGQIILLLTVPFLRGTPPPKRLFIWFGFFVGFSFWAAHASIVFILASILLLLIHSRSSRRILICSTPFMLIGAAPLVVYNVIHPGATLVFLAKSFAGIGRETYQLHGSGGYLLAVLQHRLLISFPSLAGNLAQIFTCHMPGWVDGINFTLWAIVLICPIALKLREKIKDDFRVVPSDLLFVTFLTGLILGYSGRDIPRHFLPIYGVVPVMAASLVRTCPWKKTRLILGPLIFLNLLGVLFLRTNFRLRPDYWKSLLTEVRELNIQSGYTDFNTAYKINFMTREAVIFSPVLSFGSDRYPPYTDLVDRAHQPAYILPSESEKLSVFEDHLARSEISFQKLILAHHIIYTSLSQPLHSRELEDLYQKPQSSPEAR